MKKFRQLLLLLACATLFVSCGDKPDDDKYGGIDKSDPRYPLYEALDDTEGLIISQVYLDNPFMYRTGSQWEELVACVGHKNNRMWLGLFRHHGEKYISVFTWTDTKEIEQTIEVDLGYGEKKILDFAGVGISSSGRSGNIIGVGYDNGNKFISLEKFYSDSIIYTFITITSDNQAVTLLNEPIVPIEYYKLWYENSLIVSAEYHISNLWHCYDSNGEKLYECPNNGWLENNYYLKTDLSNVEPISYEQGICLNNHLLYSSFARIDMSAQSAIWTSLAEFTDIESNARLDSVKLTNKEGNIWYYAFYYTLYSGEKVTRELSLNIETGEITYL